MYIWLCGRSYLTFSFGYKWSMVGEYKGRMLLLILCPCLFVETWAFFFWYLNLLQSVRVCISITTKRAAFYCPFHWSAVTCRGEICSRRNRLKPSFSTETSGDCLGLRQMLLTLPQYSKQLLLVYCSRSFLPTWIEKTDQIIKEQIS